MNYLLDTHTFIWSTMYSSNLSSTARKIIEDKKNTIFVSTISFWEISLKYSLNKLDFLKILPQDLPNLAIESGFKHLPLFPENVANYNQLNEIWHKDPFDRMLIWQAIQKNLILISKDENVSKYQSSGLKIIW